MKSIYIHIPFCEKKCHYCDFFSITDLSLVDKFVDALCKEIRIFANNYQGVTSIDTIFFGGGTPSILKPKQLEKILNTLKQFWTFEHNIEISMESNPGTLDYSKLQDFNKIGINRLSIGVQSFNDDLLKFLQRIHSQKQAIEAIENSFKAGFDNVNVDLIFSIPTQNIKDIKRDIDIIFNFNIPHISAYSLIYEKGTPLYSDYEKGLVKPNSLSREAQQYLTAIKYLNEKGYSQYEVSNFSLEGRQCRHNLNYWHRKDYISFGPAAHSFYNEQRIINHSNMFEYFNSINSDKLPIANIEILSTQDILTETIFLSLRADGLATDTLFGINPKVNYKLENEIKNMLKEELIVPFEDKIRLTAKGYSICNSVTLKILDILSI